MVRKRVSVDMENVQTLISEGWSLTQICKQLNVTRKTLWRRMKQQNQTPKEANGVVTDEILLKTIEGIVQEFPNIGYRQMWCALRVKDLRVTRARVMKILRIVDPSGMYARASKVAPIPRIKYSVPHAHYLWHIDTNLKLGPWKIVIRGAVDGYSRTVIYLDVGTSNTAEKQLEAFLKGVAEYTLPYRTRTDKGGENRDIAMLMLLNRGCGVKAHICGASVHNVRIERFWLDLNVQVTRIFRGYFHNLEQLQLLDREDPTHLSVLHHVYIPCIQKKLADYRNIYNSHKLRTECHKTPRQLLRLKPMPEEKIATSIISLPQVLAAADNPVMQEVERITEVKPFNQVSIDPSISSVVAATVATVDITQQPETELELQKVYVLVLDVVKTVQERLHSI